MHVVKQSYTKIHTHTIVLHCIKKAKSSIFLFIIYSPEEATEGKIQFYNAYKRKCTVKVWVDIDFSVFSGAHKWLCTHPQRHTGQGWSTPDFSPGRILWDRSCAQEDRKLVRKSSPTHSSLSPGRLLWKFLIASHIRSMNCFFPTPTPLGV